VGMSNSSILGVDIYNIYLNANKPIFLFIFSSFIFDKGLDNVNNGQLKTKKVRFFKLWKTVVLNNKKEISKDEFTALMTQRFEADKTGFIDMIKEYELALCKLVDINGDDFISREEFVMNLFAVGHRNKTKEFFLAFLPKNGKIHVQKIISEIIRFTTENFESTDIFKNEYESDI
jgi:hypothetical protein